MNYVPRTYIERSTGWLWVTLNGREMPESRFALISEKAADSLERAMGKR